MTQSLPPMPPQSQMDYGYGVPQRRSNGPAIASLVLGIVGCIPLVTGLLAIFFGFAGIRKSRDPAVGGKGMAIAGLVLGMVSVLGWVGFGGMLGYAYVESKPARIIAKQFLTDVSAGNINATMANSTGFTADQLQTQSGQMASFGALQSVSISSFNLSTFNGQTTMNLGGTAAFANGVKSCTFTLAKSDGVYKVTAYWVK
jgi:hypothetical protein